ncbi:MAG: holin family protein, partial [Bacteroidota bacterium]
MSTFLALIPAISTLLDKLIPDPIAREKAKIELLRAERSSDLEELRLALTADAAQTEINKQEAAHADRFVAGWRPFIGWVCGVAFAYHFILQPLLAFAIMNSGGEVKLPSFDMDALST